MDDLDARQLAVWAVNRWSPDPTAWTDYDPPRATNPIPCPGSCRSTPARGSSMRTDLDRHAVVFEFHSTGSSQIRLFALRAPRRLPRLPTHPPERPLVGSGGWHTAAWQETSYLYVLTIEGAPKDYFEVLRSRPPALAHRETRPAYPGDRTAPGLSVTANPVDHGPVAIGENPLIIVRLDRRIDWYQPLGSPKEGAMPRILLLALVCLGSSYFSTAASAQTTKPLSDVGTDLFAELPSEGTVTPEMWFYQQEYQRYKSPQEAVRRKAEFRAAQRRNRLAAQRWFGFSNLRPTANPVPYYGSYSAAWVGSLWDPFAWSGQGGPLVVYHTARRSD